MRDQLFSLNNSSLKKFNERIINTNYQILGVKTDVLKRMAKDNVANYKSYFDEPHQYFEEFMIHGFMLGYLKIQFQELEKYIDDYVLMIDNWAMVDSIVSNLKLFKKNLKASFELAEKYILSNMEFKVRFGYCILLMYFINPKEQAYLAKILDLCNKKHKEYYVQMMVAWLISVSYIKFKDETINFLNDCKLDDFTFNKVISKICDSFRVSKGEKEQLKTIRR